MPTYNQYVNNGQYQNANNTWLLSQSQGITSDWTMIRTGQYQYVMVIGDTVDGVNYSDAEVITVNTAYSSSNASVSRSKHDSVIVNVSNEYYSYGTLIGQKSDLTGHSNMMLNGGVMCVNIAILLALFLQAFLSLLSLRHRR